MGSGAGQLIRPNELDDKQANWFWLDAAENRKKEIDATDAWSSYIPITIGTYRVSRTV